MGRNVRNALDEILGRLGLETGDNVAEKKTRLRIYLGLRRRSHSCWLVS